MITTRNTVGTLASSLIDGTTPVADVAQQCLAAGISAEAVAHELSVVERAMVASAGEGRASAASTEIANRLRAMVDALAPLWGAARSGEDEPVGTIALASLPGDAHDVGRHLWRSLLTSGGYHVQDLGLRAPVIVAQHVAKLKPDAIGIYVFDARGQAAVQSLVANLLRRGLQVPLLISGPGVDEAFARWVSVPGGGTHYWAGVYYCEDVPEALQVLQQIVLFEPPPSTHTHDHGQPELEEGCDSCCGCALSDSCDLPEATAS